MFLPKYVGQGYTGLGYKCCCKFNHENREKRVEETFYLLKLENVKNYLLKIFNRSDVLKKKERNKLSKKCK